MMIRAILQSITVFVCVSLIFATNAMAQTNQNSSNDAINVVKHKDWAVQCQESEQKKLSSCFMFQRILVKDSGDSLLRMTVDRPQDLSAPRAIFVVPLGTYVAPGISVQIDANDPLDLEIEYCDKLGCYAGKLLDQSILNLLKRGRQAVVRFQSRGRQQIILPISLSGFSSGLAALN